MTDDIFDRIRQKRKDALAESFLHAHDRFNPFRSGPILGVSILPELDPTRATVTLTLEDAKREVLPHFYAAHAKHLDKLTPSDRIEYLRSIWLNYSRALCIARRPE